MISPELQFRGIAGVPSSAGEFMWAGYAGTYFWVDPKEELTARGNSTRSTDTGVGRQHLAHI